MDEGAGIPFLDPDSDVEPAVVVAKIGAKET